MRKMLTVASKLTCWRQPEICVRLFRARVVKPGRTLTFCEAQAYALTDDGGEKLVATMTGTLMALRRQHGVSTKWSTVRQREENASKRQSGRP